MALNKATVFLALGAITSGVGAAYFTDEYINNRVSDEQARLASEYKPVRIVVANQDLHVGDVLGYDNLSIRDMPAGYVHKTAVREELSSSVVGRRIMQDVSRGEALLSGFLASRSGAGFSNLIEEGKRALTFPVDIVSSVSGLLRPGDKIDLLLSLVRPNADSITLPLLTNVSILATGGIVDDEGRLSDDGSYQTITLVLDPLDAAKITHARETGSLTVILRSAKETEMSKSELKDPVTINTLLGKNIRKKKRARRPSVDVIIGGL